VTCDSPGARACNETCAHCVPCIGQDSRFCLPCSSCEPCEQFAFCYEHTVVNCSSANAKTCKENCSICLPCVGQDTEECTPCRAQCGPCMPVLHCTTIPPPPANLGTICSPEAVTADATECVAACGPSDSCNVAFQTDCIPWEPCVNLQAPQNASTTTFTSSTTISTTTAPPGFVTLALTFFGDFDTILGSDLARIQAFADQLAALVARQLGILVQFVNVGCHPVPQFQHLAY